MSEDGKSVDYQGLRNDDLFLEFENHVDQLYTVNLDELNEAQLKSFFISINLQIMHYYHLIYTLFYPRCLQHINNSWVVQM